MDYMDCSFKSRLNPVFSTDFPAEPWHSTPVKKVHFEKNKKNSKKHLQKILCYDIINLGHAREIKTRNSD